MNAKGISFGRLFQLLAEDLRTADGDFTSPGIHALAVYRFGVWRSQRAGILRIMLYPLYATMAVLVRNLYGIEISWRTRIGRRVRIAHQSGIVIHPDAVIGDDCVIRQNVTLGAVSAVTKGAPTLGNRVEIGAGAVLIGAIRVGDDVRIGPNAVVMTNVPAGSIVISPQSRILPPAQPKRAPRQEEEESNDIPVGSSPHRR